MLAGVSIAIEPGDTVAVVGPSGTGKSVLLKIVTGLMSADSGEVSIFGDSMTQARSEKQREAIRSRMGVLFQSAALLDSLTLLDNVAFALRYRRCCSEKEVYKRSMDLLERVGLSGKELALPGEVSIGMRKRVGLARALVTNPEVVLFDEPNTGLDPQTGQEMYELIQDVQEREKITGIVISHEIPEVFQVCHRVIMLYNGVVQEDNAVDKFMASKNPVVEQFVKGRTDGPIQMV